MRQVDNNIPTTNPSKIFCHCFPSQSHLCRTSSVRSSPLTLSLGQTIRLYSRLNQNNRVRGEVRTRTWVSRGQWPREAAFSAPKAKTRKEEHLYPNPSILSFAYRCTTDHVDHLGQNPFNVQGLILQNQSLFFIFSWHNHSKVWFLEISLYLFYYFFSVFVVIFVIR